MGGVLYNRPTATVTANGQDPPFATESAAWARDRLDEGSVVYPWAAMPVRFDPTVTAMDSPVQGAEFHCILETSWDGAHWFPVYDFAADVPSWIPPYPPDNQNGRVLGQGHGWYKPVEEGPQWHFPELGSSARVRWTLALSIVSVTFRVQVKAY